MMRILLFCVAIFGLSTASIQAGEVKLTGLGIEIDAGSAGKHLMSYPRLANPNDQSSFPEQITVQPDGQSGSMVYQPGGKLSIQKQPDGNWLFRFTEIPSDKMKFWFGITFPLSESQEGAAWAVDGKEPQPFPATAGPINLYQGNPSILAFHKNQVGFSIACPQKTFVQIQDVRGWGKKTFNFALCYYFPGKTSVPEINYSLSISAQ